MSEMCVALADDAFADGLLLGLVVGLAIAWLAVWMTRQRW